VADAFGLATTYIQATDPMCGQWMLQALDEDSWASVSTSRESHFDQQWFQMSPFSWQQKVLAFEAG
jgi:hypothetical protein